MNAIGETVGLLVDTWKMLVGRLPTGTAVHSDGVASLLGNVPLPFLNLCIHDSPMADLDDVRRRLSLSVKRASQCPFPWMFALCEDWAPRGWEAVVAESGLAPALSLYGMATDRLKPPRRALPKLEYRRVQDEATARDIAEVNMHAYGMSPETVECICNLHLWRADSYGYVGYVDGRAMTCSATFPVNNTIYVGFVATLPDAHGKGFGEAVMRHSIEKGGEAMGLSRTTLHGTEAGRGLYEAMGYETSARFSLIAEPHEEGT